MKYLDKVYLKTAIGGEKYAKVRRCEIVANHVGTDALS